MRTISRRGFISRGAVAAGGAAASASAVSGDLDMTFAIWEPAGAQSWLASPSGSGVAPD